MNGKKPLVSVLIPAYNHGEWLEETINSVVTQTYGFENVQLIVTDDCSNDNSAGILKRLASRYDFRLIVNEKNCGLASSLNEMLNLATGDYITTIASDDIMFPDRIENQVNILIKNPEIDILAGTCVLIDSSGNIISNFKKDHEPLVIYSFEDLFLRLKPGFPAGSVIIRRELITRIGGYDPEYRIEDYYFWLKAAYNNAKIARCNIPFVYYRIHGKSFSSNIEIMEREKLKILELYNFHPQYNRAIQNHKIISLAQLVFFSRISAIRNIIMNPALFFNRNMIRTLIILVLPGFVLRKKFPEDYFRYGAA
jgi:alpha-1,3-rhamnosyltransferase